MLPEEMGYVLSTPAVPEFLTGREFLKFLWKSTGTASAGKDHRRVFDQVGIAPEDRDRLLKDYSHGMKNKMQMLVQDHCQAPPFCCWMNRSPPWMWWRRRK